MRLGRGPTDAVMVLASAAAVAAIDRLARRDPASVVEAPPAVDVTKPSGIPVVRSLGPAIGLVPPEWSGNAHPDGDVFDAEPTDDRERPCRVLMP